MVGRQFDVAGVTGEVGKARFDLTDLEWSVIGDRAVLPNKPRGVPRGERPASADGNSGGCGRERPLSGVDDHI
jgi:hypothetical protein